MASLNSNVFFLFFLMEIFLKLMKFLLIDHSQAFSVAKYTLFVGLWSTHNFHFFFFSLLFFSFCASLSFLILSDV